MKITLMQHVAINKKLNCILSKYNYQLLDDLILFSIGINIFIYKCIKSIFFIIKFHDIYFDLYI